MQPFLTDFWIFHLVNYLLAAAFYTLLGRVVLGLFVRQDSPFFVMRFFRLITDPFIAALRPVTPSFLHPAMIPLYVAFWVFVVRLAFGLVMLRYGLAPRLGAAA